jgi:hypothetical protein
MTAPDRPVPAPSSFVEAELPPDLERERRRGHAGGFITRHRALLFSPSDPVKMIPAFLLAIAFVLFWYVVNGGLDRYWSTMLNFWQEALGLGGAVTSIQYRLFGAMPFRIPMLHVDAGLPSITAWWFGLFLTAALTVLSAAIPRRYLPVSYLLRVAAFFQGTAQVFFLFWKEAFPYGLTGYLHGMLIASWMFIAIVPIALGLTYFIFDFTLQRKIGLAAIIMGYQTILVPLQYEMHAYVIHHGSLLFMPLMFLVFGLPLNVFSFIAFYSWGASWRDRLYEESVQWKTRGRVH